MGLDTNEGKKKSEPTQLYSCLRFKKTVAAEAKAKEE